jgi:O-antigen ligase/Tfp pilus assembly protein PilF
MIKFQLQIQKFIFLRGDVEKDKLIKKASDILLLLTLAVSPLVFSVHANGVFWSVEQFFFKFCLSLLLAIFLFRIFLYRNVSFFKTSFDIVFAGFISANILGIFVAHGLYSFLNTVALNFLYFAFFYFVLDYAAAEDDNKWKILAAMFIPAVVMAAYGIFQSSGHDPVSWQTNFNGRASSTLGNPDFLAGHMVLLIPLSYALIFPLRGWKMLLMICVALILTAALFITQTRGALVAYFVSIAVLFAALAINKSGKDGKHIKAMALGLAVIVAAGSIYFFADRNGSERIKNMVNFNEDSINLRLHLWQSALYMIKDNFLFGAGAGNFHSVYPFYLSKYHDAALFKQVDFIGSVHAHNDFLQFPAEYGVIGAAFFYLMLGIFVYSGFKGLKNNRGDKYISGGVLAGGCAIMAHAMFNFPFSITPTAALFYAMMSLSVQNNGTYELRNIHAGRITAVFSGIAAAFCVIMALFFIVQLSSNYYLGYARDGGILNNTGAAVIQAQRAVSTDPWNEDNYLLYAQLLAKSGDTDRAAYNYRMVFDLDPAIYNVDYFLYDYYSAKNMKPDALAAGESMYKLSPYSLKSVKAAGFANYAVRNYARAADIFEIALKDNPDNYDLLTWLSSACGAGGDAQKAVFFAERAINVSGRNRDAYMDLAFAYYKSGDRDSAVKTLNKMLRLYPGDKQAQEMFRALNK